MEDKVTKGGRTRRTTAKAPATAATKTAATRPTVAPKATASSKAAAPAAAAATGPVAFERPERAEMVRMAAYFRAERRGFTPGYEVEDWLAAEAEVAAKVGPAPAASPRKATAGKPPKA